MHAITHRRVLAIALPIVLSNATIPILGIVDTAVVGQMGAAAPIGAVGIGAIILTAIYWIFGFLRMGTSGLTAQAAGAGADREVLALLWRSLLFGGAAGLLLILLHPLLLNLAFWLAPASAEVETLARGYASIRIFSAPAAIALYGVTGWMIARERSVHVLMVQLLLNGLNILLDMVFVMGLGWGVEGVAVATLIAEWSALLFGLYLLRDALPLRMLRDPILREPARLKQMLSVNGDIMIRSVLLQAAFVSFLFLASSFDDVTLAANQISLQFLHVTAYALDGFAFAAEALVGQAMGAADRAALRRGAAMATFWGAFMVALLAAAFALGGGVIIDLMSTSEDVRAAARLTLPWMVLAPLIGLWAWMLDGIFIGATRTRDMRNMMVVSFAFYLLCVMTLLPLFGNHGLWASMILMFGMRGITLAVRYPALERSAVR